jgi:hypothetical protein
VDSSFIFVESKPEPSGFISGIPMSITTLVEALQTSTQEPPISAAHRWMVKVMGY